MEKNPYLNDFYIGQTVEYTNQYTSPFLLRAKLEAKAEIIDIESARFDGYHLSVKWLDSLSMGQSNGWYKAWMFKPVPKLNRFDLINGRK